ncbi:unnamed protein product [Gongylonema pulchrum]|uniref:Transmembrane protein n=1 Tax=Gongylonema pulchrum TaxID=637853 RepID=A0A183D2Q3_9BILA|nr:unnamed protein product [Gongylonema pulchrum]
MSVDKTIEELSYTLAQLGTLVGHINSQIGQLASRINLTLDTFDQSIAGIALDANLMSTHVAHTVSQVNILLRAGVPFTVYIKVPNGWLFYLLFLTIIAVFVLLSVVLLLSMITRCNEVFRLIKQSRTSGQLTISVLFPMPNQLLSFDITARCH